MYIRISISAQSAASTPPAPERMVTTASRSSYSPDSRVRTSIASMSSRNCLSSASASATASAPSPLFFIGEFVEHRQVLDTLPQLLDATQLALGVGQLAGDLLGARLVVPQLRIGRLGLELVDARAQALDVDHPFHGGQGGVECGDIGLPVEVHGSSGYRRLRSVP